MKKSFLLIAFFAVSFAGQSQELNDIKKMVVLSQFAKAKPDIDNFLSNEKNAAKPEGWYYKAYIYNSLGRDTSKPAAQSETLYTGAFNAVKKYMEIDPKAPLTKEESNGTVFNIYYGLYDLGIRTYNNQDFPASYSAFQKTLEVHDYIYNNNLVGYEGLKFSKHDTDIVWNLAVLAMELKKKNEAMAYYKRIADEELSDEKYVGAYDELILQAKRNKNAEEFNKYLALAKKFYPIDKPYWEAQQIDFVTSDAEGEELLNKYEELTKTLPDNYMVFYNYALEIDKFITSTASSGKDIAMYRQKMEDLFKKALTINSTIEANLQLANIYYSKSYDIQERAARITGTKPTEVKLKTDLNAQFKTTINQSIPYAEEAVKLLKELKEYKFADKANYKLALEILSRAYKVNGNMAKSAEYEKVRNEVDNL